jgi:hypothetical protein
MTSGLEKSIRAAVASGAYAEAELLLSGYCRQLQTTDEILRAQELLDWMLRSTRAARAHSASRLKEVSAAIQYRNLAPDRLHTWRLDA